MGSDVLLKMWEDFWEHICDNQWALYGKYESMGWVEILPTLPYSVSHISIFCQMVFKSAL